MIQFLEQFLIWAAVEFLLSGLLFFSYHLWIKQFANPLDRFNFLCLSFGVLLFLPWVPVPEISEPFLQNLISGAVIALQGQGKFSLSNLLLFSLPCIYFVVLLFRAIRIFHSTRKINQICTSGIVASINSAYPVVLHDHAIAPMAVGILNPLILISNKIYRALSNSERDLMILHEEEHIRRSDGLSNLLRIFVREVLFFSPFIWNLSQRFEEEMEISVDTAVLTQRRSSARAYGSLLVKVAEICQIENRFNPIGAFLSNSSIKRRIIAMKQVSKRRARVLSGLALGAFVMVAMLGASLFGTQAYSSDSSAMQAVSDDKAVFSRTLNPGSADPDLERILNTGADSQDAVEHFDEGIRK